MKKYIFAFLAIAMFAFTSCENDPIEIKSVGSLKVSVNTGALYTETQTSTSIKNLLGKNTNYNIGVMVLVYDSDGKLWEKTLKTVNTYQTLQFEFTNIPDDSYTVITLETFVDTDDNNESPYWKLVDESTLSTARLDTKLDRIYWYGVAGMDVQKVKVTSEGNTLNITPKSIGSMVKFGYENFQNSNLVRLGLQIKNTADGIYLDPTRNKELYYEGFTKEGTWGNRGYFLNKDGLTDKDEQDLFILESGLQSYCYGASTIEQWNNGYKFTAYPSNKETFTFEAGKYYRAFCIYDPNTQGLNTYLGNLGDEFEQWRKANTPTTPGTTTLFKEPYLVWGSSVEAVKSAMTQYTFGGFLESEDKTSYILWYQGKDSEEEMDYYFTSQTGNLYRVYIFMNSSAVGEDQLNAFFTEKGYIYAETGEGYTVYKTSDDTTYVQFGLNTQGYWYICYYDPNNSLNSRKSYMARKR